MQSTIRSARLAQHMVRLLVLLTLLLGGLAWLASLSSARAAVHPALAWSGWRAPAKERELQPSERARLLLAEVVFGAAILAAPLGALRGRFAPLRERGNSKGFPWGRVASTVALVVGVVGLAAVFTVASYPSLLHAGFRGAVELPARQQALRHVPVALAVGLALWGPPKVAQWRQERPTLRQMLGDALLLAAGLVVMGMLYG